MVGFLPVRMLVIIQYLIFQPEAATAAVLDPAVAAPGYLPFKGQVEIAVVFPGDNVAAVRARAHHNALVDAPSIADRIAVDEGPL